MPRNGSGGYSLPHPVFTPGTLANATQVTANNSDVVAAIAASIARDGQTLPTANLPMAGFRHTNVGVATARSHYARADQVQDGAFSWAGAATGTANDITISLTPVIVAYTAGLKIRFVSSATNTGAVTLNVNGVGAIAVTRESTTPLAAGAIPSGALVEVIHDGTEFRLIGLTQQNIGSLADVDTESTAPSAGDTLVFNGSQWVPGVGRFTGEEAQFAGSTPPAGWVLSGTTVGDAGSGSDRANADTEALFRLLWADHGDASCPILTNAGAAAVRGASADADWAAGRRMTTPSYEGRGAIGTGQGSGLTNRTLGQTGGEEAHAQIEAEVGPHSHTVNVQTNNNIGGNNPTSTSANGTNTTRFTNQAGGGSAFNVMQPFRATNFIIKL